LLIFIHFEVQDGKTNFQTSFVRKELVG